MVWTITLIAACRDGAKTQDGIETDKIEGHDYSETRRDGAKTQDGIETVIQDSSEPVKWCRDGAKTQDGIETS